jgi:dTDP-4-dehydrorhamnose reductase
MKPPILATGLSGMIGSRVRELLGDEFEFEDLSLETGFDITNEADLREKFAGTGAEICLHLAAVTDVDACERERELSRQSLSWRVNVEATANIARLARRRQMYLVYLSTEFVFDGERPIGERYVEEDRPRPVNWYGETKRRGEEAVEKEGGSYLVVRTASPYRSRFELKTDFVRRISGRLKQGKAVKAVVDARFSPTLVDDLALGLRKVIKDRLQGKLHLVGSEPLSPLRAVEIIAEVEGCSRDLIEPVSNEAYFRGRAKRGLNLALANDKAREWGIEMRSFREGIEFLREKR